MGKDRIAALSNEELLAKLLEIVIEEQWSGETNQSCSCHPQYISSCPFCGAHKYVREHPEKGCMSNMIIGPHKPDCERMKLIKTTKEALIKYNEQMGENYYDENGEDKRIYVPS